MKKRLIVLFFLLVPIASALFYSCRCPDIEIQYRYFSHKTLFLRNLDNSGARPVESESLQLNKNAFGIRLVLEREVVYSTTTPPLNRRKQANSILIQSAYALSFWCPAFFYSAKDKVESIKIFTMNDFDNQRLANSDITDLFRVARSFSTIENFVANIQYSFDSESESIFERWIRELSVDLLLMTPPTASNKHQFEIQVALSDGRVLKSQTTEIELI